MLNSREMLQVALLEGRVCAGCGEVIENWLCDHGEGCYHWACCPDEKHGGIK
jgi:hypothetical protein